MAELPSVNLTEIEKMKTAFVECAVRAYKCHYDGIELHAAHGYLICQFLSKKFNKRKDIYEDESLVGGKKNYNHAAFF